MKNALVLVGMLTLAGIANATNVTNLFPNGDFESGGGGPGAWVENGGGDTFNYPATGGNPGGYGIIDDSSVTWGIWVGGNDTPLDLGSLGLVAGQTYTFVQDMEIITGASIGGLKIESWGPAGYISDSGDMHPVSGTTNWATYTFTYHINAAATGLKIVPLWGAGGQVGFDNLGVVVRLPDPLAVAITNLVENQVVSSNFTIAASAIVFPGSISNVSFYIDGVLKGVDTTAPYSYAASNTPAGPHTVYAVAMDKTGNSVTSTVVDVSITSAVLLTAAISSPTNGAVVSTSSFTINAGVSVSLGVVTNVSFYVDGAKVGSSNAAPFNFNVTGVSAAAHALKIVAKDNSGDSVTSSVVNVTAINFAPTVGLTGTANGSAFLVGASVPLTATATDDGAVSSVDFYVDGSLVGSDSTSPYTATWANATLGAHVLSAVAHDNGGLSTTSSVVNITVLTTFSAYEPFSYFGSWGNATPTTAAGFTGNWTSIGGNSLAAGLSYNDLPVVDFALNSTGGRAFENFAAPLSGGTEYISFLCTQTGDPGGVRNGIYLLNGGTGLYFGFGFAAASATQGKMGLGSILTTGGGYQAANQLTVSPNLQTYGNTYFIVLKIDFNTSGTNDTVSVYINPATHAGAPGIAADQTINSFDVGTITGIGLNAGNTSFTIDEIRRSTSYAEVSGGALTPTIPTTLALSVGANKRISWTAASTNFYEPQESSDSNSWSDVGSTYFGNATNSLYDPTPSPFYRVLEIAPSPQEQIVDGGIEVDGGGGLAFYWISGGSQPPVRITSDFHTGTACMSLFVTNSDVTANTSDLQQNLQFVGNSTGISAGSTYNFSFWAKSLGKNPAGGYVQQYKIAWLNNSSQIVGAVGFAGFNGGNGVWSQITTGPIVAPAGAVNALIEIFAATGGIANDYGGVLVDDFSLASFTPGSVINTLTPTVQNGQGFTATVNANGGTATAATGTVQFTTNNVGQSQGAVVNGSAFSTPAILPASYTVTAVYSGDANYIGSSTNLVVGGGGGGGVNPTPTNIVATVSGNQLTLTWPADHTGWTLQAQTNSISQGLGTNWFDVSASTATNQVTMTVNPANPTVFYRLKFTP